MKFSFQLSSPLGWICTVRLLIGMIASGFELGAMAMRRELQLSYFVLPSPGQENSPEIDTWVSSSLSSLVVCSVTAISLTLDGPSLQIPFLQLRAPSHGIPPSQH